MKKMLMVGLVLAMASLAMAAVEINITDGQGRNDITLFPSDTIELYIWYTGDDIVSYDLEVGVISGPGSLLDPIITADGRNPDYDYAGPGNTLDWEMTGSADGIVLGKGLGLPLGIVIFHCDGEGDVLIDMMDIYTMDMDWNQVIPVYTGMVIHQIPEPATMALLAFGGLLLRRKK
ncbi:MAG: PEP-CTERM sorting domain-containing protein [Sedimentisphaerales bacterium]|nr:PEP-CTERM sorting domain-containing protein [Sedimentisphaerales bacterium]